MRKKYRKNNNADMFFVYMHVFPNDKVYVGITSQDPPENRWLGGGVGYKNQIRMWRAIQKYGWENVEHVIVARYVSAETAIKMEENLIELYNSADKNYGYNASPGGWAMSEDGKQKLSELHKGKKMSAEAIKKMSESLKGRKPSEKSIARLIEYNRTRDYSKMVQPNEAPVLQFDVTTAKFVKEYKSINRAAHEYGLDPRNIKCCIDEHVVQYRGYLWIDKSKATEDYITRRLYEAQNPPHSYPVMMHNIIDGTDVYFKSQKELVSELKLEQRRVSRAVVNGYMLMKKYKVYRSSIPDYVLATGKPFYDEINIDNNANN